MSEIPLRRFAPPRKFSTGEQSNATALIGVCRLPHQRSETNANRRNNYPCNMKSKMPKAFAGIGGKAILSRAVQSACFPRRHSPEREMEALRHLKNCTAADGDRRFENWLITGRVWVSN